ncbi:MAG: hypothetical protein ACE5G9_09270 [Nitrospinales bacterium]
MDGLKIVYYGFGAFIGFICGTVINLIFYWVEKSGNPLLGGLAKNYGDFGRFLVELINALPYFGMALGIVMVKILFRKQWEKEERE